MWKFIFPIAIISAVWAAESVAVAKCQCRANGRTFEQGELTCLRLPSGNTLAQCGMSLNNSSWKIIGVGCPEARQDIRELLPPFEYSASVELGHPMVQPEMP